jgi:transcriptional regulator with XRE-family HTH domain
VLRERLVSEFEERKGSNPRYSIRAFAAFLGDDHSTVSQVMRGVRRATVAQVRQWSRKLGIPAEEISVLIATEQAADADTLHRQTMLRHWTAEAEAILRDGVHLEILRLCRSTEFRPDSRWIAQRSGASTDAVNVALQRLLRIGLLQITAAGEWRDCTGLAQLTGREFRKLALQRIREKAAEDRIKFGKEDQRRG